MEKIIILCMMMALVCPVFCNDEKRDVSAQDEQLLKGIRDRLDKLESNLDKHCKPNGNGEVQSYRGGGAMYTRWGRQSCPKGADLVYKGQAGGSHNSHTGAAVNYLCLPFNPNWDRYNDKTTNHAYLYGAEIATDHQNVPGSTVDHKYHGQDASCAVCRSRHRTSSLMIPGRNHCDKGWHLEYKGYLMAGRHNHRAATEYVCMDRHPHMLHGGHRQYWHKIFYSVEAQCGSLRCPPYKNGRETTCAVCTK